MIIYYCKFSEDGRVTIKKINYFVGYFGGG